MLMSVIKAATRPTIVNMVAKVYIPVLFPLTFLIAQSAVKLDQMLGFQAGFLPEPTNLIVAASSLVLGGILWLWTYEQLTRLGDGSPSPTAGRTQRLATSGIYAHCRNPSIFGKLLGLSLIHI